MFSPGGSPDHPDQAGLAIDGNPDTSWPTDIYQDAAPFPAFKEGVGLPTSAPSPTTLSEVTIDVPSTGTEVQIRAADSARPNSLSDTTELTPTVALQPGENTITVDNQTKPQCAGVDFEVGHPRRAEPHQHLERSCCGPQAIECGCVAPFGRRRPYRADDVDQPLALAPIGLRYAWGTAGGRSSPASVARIFRLLRADEAVFNAVIDGWRDQIRADLRSQGTSYRKHRGSIMLSAGGNVRRLQFNANADLPKS